MRDAVHNLINLPVPSEFVTLSDPTFQRVDIAGATAGGMHEAAGGARSTKASE